MKKRRTRKVAWFAAHDDVMRCIVKEGMSVRATHQHLLSKLDGMPYSTFAAYVANVRRAPEDLIPKSQWVRPKTAVVREKRDITPMINGEVSGRADSGKGFKPTRNTKRGSVFGEDE